MSMEPGFIGHVPAISRSKQHGVRWHGFALHPSRRKQERQSTSPVKPSAGEERLPSEPQLQRIHPPLVDVGLGGGAAVIGHLALEVVALCAWAAAALRKHVLT